MSDKISIEAISAELRAAIANLDVSGKVEQTGVVTRVGDGVAWIYGLTGCGFNELIDIEGANGQNVRAFVLNLLEDEVGAVLLGEDSEVKAGAKVKLTGKVVEIPVGPELIGRVIDPLGNPLDGGPAIKTKATGLVERPAPGVLDRKSVDEPMMTGIMAIDTMVPIGRGQRELIIGDRQTGKTAIALDTILSQAKSGSDVISIYVAIGQKMSKVSRLVSRLKAEGAMDKAIVIATSASDAASLQFLAPYAGAAIGEYFRDNGGHALIIYDDLSKHAWAYRQMSLLLRRPPGREAYPGDVFYLHSRLLERAAKLSDKLGGGSLTALPVIETQAGDLSAYIPTNVISITDGQIFLETDLFYQGIRPAISVGSSVSRVGGSAQTKAVKDVAGALRLELAQYRELAAFAQLSTDLDPETKARIDRGMRLTEILKQPQYSPFSIAEQVLMLTAATDGSFDAVAVDDIKKAAAELLRRAHSEHADLVKRLNTGKKVSDDDAAAMKKLGESVAKAMTVEEKKEA
jgi:F-type H+-transporting ATPase subunit alpha